MEKKDLLTERLEKIEKFGGYDEWRKNKRCHSDCEDGYKERHREYEREFNEDTSHFILRGEK